MKNKLSLLLLISVLNFKAHDSLRKRTIDFSIISTSYFLNNNTTNSKIINIPVSAFDFEAKLIFGKRKWKHVLFFSRDSYKYKLTYGFDYVVGVKYNGTKPVNIYDRFVDVDRVVNSNYFNVGYGLSKRYKINDKFSMLSNIEFCVLVHSIDNIKNNYINSAEPIPNEAMVQGSYKSQVNFGRVAISYKINGIYQLTNKLSFLTGINLTSSFGDEFYGNGLGSDEYENFFSNTYRYSRQIRPQDFPISTTYQQLRIFASINIGVNYKIQ